MGTVAQRMLNDVNCDNLCVMASNGDKDAGNYLSSICFISRVMDDLIDKDHPVPPENICRAFFMLLVEIPTNPFFLRHPGSLIGMHIASYNAWMDANAWEKGNDKLKKTYAHVMKAFINEIFPMVAYITGGHDSMRKVSEVMRSRFIKKEVS